MKNIQETIYFDDEDLEKDISFDVSKEIRISTKVTFKKGDVIESLVKRIKELENKVSELSHNFSHDSLLDVWSNKYDERWDTV